MNRKKKYDYMEMCLQLDGKENVYLRIPTVWDSVQQQWVGFIKTPKTQRLIHGKGKNSFDLQNSFNEAMSAMIHESKEMGEEIFGMFMPAFYWED